MRCAGLVLENGKCVSDKKCIEGCQLCEDTKVCKACAPNYSLKTSTSGETSCVKVEEDLTGCNVESGKCGSCMANYYVGTLEGETLKCKAVNAVGRVMMLLGVVVSGLMLVFQA